MCTAHPPPHLEECWALCLLVILGRRRLTRRLRITCQIYCRFCLQLFLVAFCSRGTKCCSGPLAPATWSINQELHWGSLWYSFITLVLRAGLAVEVGEYASDRIRVRVIWTVSDVDLEPLGRSSATGMELLNKGPILSKLLP